MSKSIKITVEFDEETEEYVVKTDDGKFDEFRCEEKEEATDEAEFWSETYAILLKRSTVKHLF